MSTLAYVRRGASTGLLLHVLRTSAAAAMVLPLSSAIANLAPPLDAYGASQWLVALLLELIATAPGLMAGALGYALLEPWFSLLWLRAMAGPDPARPAASTVRAYFASLAVSLIAALLSCVAVVGLGWLGARLGGALPPSAGLEDTARALVLAAATLLLLLGSTVHGLARAVVASDRPWPLRALVLASRRLTLRLAGVRLATGLGVLGLLLLGELGGRLLQAAGMPTGTLLVQQSLALASLFPRSVWLATSLLATRR